MAVGAVKKVVDGELFYHRRNIKHKNRNIFNKRQ